MPHNGHMWARSAKFKGPFIAQDNRVCTACGKRFLSGFIRVERGHSTGAICKKCAEISEKFEAENANRT